MQKKQIFFLIGVVTIILLALFGKTISSGLSVLSGVLFNKNIDLKKDNATQAINILLLGIGGGNHDGPDLTDTIILANVNPKTNKVNLISVPRDLWIPDLQSKINEAYASGQEKQHKGILLTKTVIQKVTGVSIDYVVVVDFSGFVKVVDELGGLDVIVPHTFDDYLYPVTGKESDLCGKTEEDAKTAATVSAELDIEEIFPCRYKHIHFDHGEAHMNGQTALEFVRSRHALGVEGSDFSRSQRQHEVIVALKKKVLSLGLLLNPVKVISIINTLKDNINTNIDSSEYDDFIKLAQKMEKAEIKTHVIDTGSGDQYGLLINPPISQATRFQWVLAPRVGNNDFSEIKTFVGCIVNGKTCTITQTSVEEVVSPTPLLTNPSTAK